MSRSRFAAREHLRFVLINLKCIGHIFPRVRDPVLPLFLHLLAGTRPSSFILQPVADHVLDRRHFEVVLSGEDLELWHAGHGHRVRRHDLTKHSSRTRQAGHLAQINRGLGVAVPLDHALRFRPEREDVARPAELVWCGCLTLCVSIENPS